MRDLGRAGEKYFGALCAAAGMAANQSETDINGWDVLVEIENCAKDLDRMSMHEGLVETKIQIKSTDGKNRYVDVELSNLKKLATSSLACFYVLLEFDSGDTPTSAYLLHVDSELIKKTLERVSDEHLKNPNVKIHKKKMRIHFSEPIKPITAANLKHLITNHIGTSHLDYLRRKHDYLKSVGFEDGAHKIKFSIVGDDKLRQLIDISLGKKDTLEIGDVHGSSLRFGVLSDTRELTNQTALLTMSDIIPASHGSISFRDKSTGRTLTFQVDLYRSPFNSWVPEKFRKIRMETKLFDFYVLNYGQSFNITLNMHLCDELEVEEALKMLKLSHMLAKPQNVDLTFKFQDLSSTAYLKSGAGFPEQSNAIETLEKIVEIKKKFEIDTPLHFNDTELQIASNNLDQLIKMISETPNIFTLTFSSTKKIDPGTEIECFCVLSFQLATYVFLELVLFTGKTEQLEELQYTTTPTTKKTFYKTMIIRNSIDTAALEEDITTIIKNYESNHLLIDLSPSFFRKIKELNKSTI